MVTIPGEYWGRQQSLADVRKDVLTDHLFLNDNVVSTGLLKAHVRVNKSYILVSKSNVRLILYKAYVQVSEAYVRVT